MYLSIIFYEIKIIFISQFEMKINKGSTCHIHKNYFLSILKDLIYSFVKGFYSL
jgi:hypothetical protein